jgi:hypothetical protein
MVGEGSLIALIVWSTKGIPVSSARERVLAFVYKRWIINGTIERFFI